MYEQEIPGDAAHERVLSIVVPCYNEEESIPLFYRETRKAANELRQRLRVQVEYVFVDDGSTDSTLDILKKLRAQDKQVHYVSFSRNFGKESALYAGLRAANGDFVATLDADLQDPPSLLPQMIEFLDGHADYDCVATRRETRRGESIVRSFFRAHVLPDHQQNFGNGDRRWGARLSLHDETIRGCGSLTQGSQPLFQRHFLLGRVQNPLHLI